MTTAQPTHYSIRELVALTGISRRTIRYYVQRTLLNPPLGAGRGHYYTDEHLSQLTQIRDLQSQGLSLDEIDAYLDAPQITHFAACAMEAPEPLPELELATKLSLAPGVELIFSHDAHAPSPRQMRALAAAARQILGPIEGEH